MQRMEGVDAGYLYMETPTMHMHTLKISLVEPAESFDPAYFTEVVLERLKDLPAFGRRALKVPFGLNHPLWIADRPIDPAQHVFVHRVPEPGGMAGLEDLIGEIAGRPLDQSLPLWEVHVTEPYDGKRVAVVAKMHHALADGGAANALLGVVTDAVREEIGIPAPQALEPTPSRLAQVRMALLDALGQVLSLPGLLYTTGRGIAGVLKLRRGSSVRVPRPILDAPRTPFNAALTARRNFATASLPLDEVRAVAKAHGVTVNDVVLALVSGALRGWLDEHGEHPGRSLLAGVPVGTDTPGLSPQRLGGNRVSNLFTTLATDVEDPAERAAADLGDDPRVQARPADPGSRPAARVGAVHAAGPDDVGDARLLAGTRRLPPQPAVQRGGLQRARPGPGRHGRERQAGRPVQRRADPRGHRPQRHRLVLRRPAELLAARLPRPRRGPAADRRAARSGPRRAEERNRRPDGSGR